MWSSVSSFLTSVDTTSVVIFLLVFLLVAYFLTTPSNLPPGPPGLPIVGNLVSLMTQSSSIFMGQFHKWRQQYGDVFTLKLGSKYVIIINSYKLAHETFVKHGDIFSGRPNRMPIIRELIDITGRGVVFSDGPLWKSLRRVTLMTMRDFGVGKKSLEQRVHDEARAVVDVFEKSQGQPIFLKTWMYKFSSNVICSIIFGNRFEYEDPVFQELISLVNRALSRPGFFLPPNFIPLSRFLPSVREKVHDIVDSFKAINHHLEKILEEREKSYDPNDIRDFVDLYIKTRSESQDTKVYNASNMRRVIIDLFVAGTETSATTMEWLILYLIAHPHVQTRCQQDVDQIVGQDRMVTLEDRKKLPYIEAVFTEILRITSIATLGVPHQAVKEGTIGGYRIPADSVVMANLREIHLDAEVWDDPHQFRPERFLDQDGNFRPPKENFMPFSAGPRVCLGEVLARMEIFMLFTTLVQFFTFTSGHKLDLEGQLGATYSAKPVPVIAKRR